jgi:hypothetical protein
MRPACCILRMLLAFVPALKCLLLACACYSLSISLSCSCSDACPHTLHAACVQLLACYCAPTVLWAPAPAARVLLLACCCTPAPPRMDMGTAPSRGDLLRLCSLLSPANMKHLLQNTSKIGEIFEIQHMSISTTTYATSQIKHLQHTSETAEIFETHTCNIRI